MPTWPQRWHSGADCDRTAGRGPRAGGWSALVEPGDAVAGSLVQMLGAERSFAFVTGPDIADALPWSPPAVRSVPWPTANRTPSATAIRTALERWRPRMGRRTAAQVVDAAAAVGGSLVVPGDPAWPKGVDDLGVHAPLVLWRRGHGRPDATPVLARPCLSVVGSRSNTLDGAEACAEITSAASDAGCTTVSGGAYGIDAVAHRVAIARRRTHGRGPRRRDRPAVPGQPRRTARQRRRQGMLLAESPPGTPPTRWRSSLGTA